MTFANRAILVGLLALAIPPAIHLLGRRRARKVILPTARFAEGAHQASRGRLWLRRVALLLLRLAVVGLLVLALAGPRLSGLRDGGPWFLVLDTSPSMRVTDAEGTAAHTRARQRLLKVARALPDDSRVTLLLTGGRTVSGTAAEARWTLERLLEPPWDEEPLGHMVRRAMALPTGGKDAAPSIRPRTVPDAHHVLATDATPHALRGMTPGCFATHEAEVILLPVGGAAANVWLALPKVRITESDTGRLLKASVELRSEPAQAPVEVFLKLDGQGTEHAIVAPANGTARFSVRVDGEGPWQGRVYVKADDALAVDNVRYFTAALRRPIRVVVVDAADEKDVRLRSADLVAAAFAGEAGVPKPVTRVEAARVDLSALGRADVTFWVGLQHPRQVEAVRKFVGRGGGLVWLPADYRPMKDAAFSDWLGIRGDPGVEQSPDGVTIDPAGYTSDLLAAFEGGTSGDLNTPVFRRQLRLPRTENTVIRFRDGLPAVQAQRHGKGRLVVLAFGPSPYWGDLAGRSEWVVLVHSLAEALAPADGPQVANLIVGNVAQSRPAGYEYVPGNYISPASEGWRIHYSVNIEPNETADLAPRVDHLAAAFAADRVRVVSGDFSPERAIPALSRPAGTDLSPFVIAALALALTAESLLSAFQSSRLWRCPRSG